MAKPFHIAVPSSLKDSVYTRTYSLGDVILREGEPGDRVCFLQGGRCKIYTSGSNGQMLIQNIVGAPEVFGMIEQFKGLNNVCTVEAYGDVTVLMVPTESFLQWLKEDNGFAIFMLEKVSHIAYMQIERQSRNIMYPLKFRLISYLMERRGHLATRANALVVDKQILAQELATTVRHLNRTLAQCEAVGGLKCEGGRIEIVDWAKLEAYKDVT